MSIYVAGSLAFDRIMSFNGAFADHILADKLHILNVSFLIDGLVEKRGGCAGNIAYTPTRTTTRSTDSTPPRWGSRASTRSRIPTLPPTGASYPPATSTT